jgi:hypothetical protein
MDVSDILREWNIRTKNKQASVEWWNSMSGGFGERPIPSFAKDEFLQLLERMYWMWAAALEDMLFPLHLKLKP